MGKPKSIAHCLFHLWRALGTAEFSLSSRAGSLDAKAFLPWAHARTVARPRAVVAILAEKDQVEPSQQCTIGIAINEDWVLRELVTEQVQQSLHALLSLFNILWKRSAHLHLFSRLDRGEGVSARFLNRAFFLQTVLKTITRPDASKKGPPLIWHYRCCCVLGAWNFFIFSQLGSTWSRERLSVFICYLPLVTWLDLYFRLWQEISRHFKSSSSGFCPPGDGSIVAVPSWASRV